MKYSVFVTVLGGMVLMMGVGCSNSESSTSQESQLVGKDIQNGDNAIVENIQASSGQNLTNYLKGVEDKLSQLKGKHAQLADQVPKTGPGANSKVVLDTILKELTKKGEELLWQIETMKSARGEDHLALQTGMDQTLKELAQSYDKALAQFAG